MNDPALSARRPAQLRVRAARIADAAALCAAERATARIPGRLISRPAELSEGAFARSIAELAPGGFYLVAECDGEILGHAVLEPAAPLAALAHARSLTIVVHPAHVGSGVGTALMRHLLEHAKSTGIERIELRARAGNTAALALYRKFGFVQEGVLRRRLKLDDGTYVDDICMAWFASDPRAANA